VLERGRLIRVDGPSVRTLHLELDEALKDESDQDDQVARVSGNKIERSEDGGGGLPTRTNATRVERDSPPAGRRRFHVFSSKTLQLSFSKPLQAAVCGHAYARSPTAASRNLLLENCRVPLSRECVHLASSRRNAPPCEEAPRPENESASHSPTNEAGSLPFGARSVGESISRLVPCQARSCVFTKKIFIGGIRCYVTSPKRRSCASDLHLERTVTAPHVERGCGAHGWVDTSLTGLGGGGFVYKCER
jgi:hypothetical protein